MGFGFSGFMACCLAVLPDEVFNSSFWSYRLAKLSKFAMSTLCVTIHTICPYTLYGLTLSLSAKTAAIMLRTD